MKNITKNYKKWMARKSVINNSPRRRSVREGDIWWAAVGENVGVEIDGKNEKFSRPIVILKKHNGLCFTAVPLTSQRHDGSWYATFEFHDKKQTAVLIQSRLMDSSRLYDRIGRMSKKDFDYVRKRYVNLFKKYDPLISRGGD